MISIKASRSLVSVIALTLSLAIMIAAAACCKTPSGKLPDDQTSESGTTPAAEILDPDNTETNDPATPQVTEGPAITADPAQTKAAYEAYKAAIEKRNELDDLVTKENIIQNISFNISGKSMQTSSKISVYMECAGIHSQEPITHMQTTEENSVDAQTEKSQVDLYVRGRKMFIKYNDAADYTIVSSIDPSVSSLTEQLTPEKLKAAYLPEGAFEAAVLTEGNDGKKSIIAVLSNASVNELFGGVTEQLEATYAAMGASDVSLKANKLEASFVISSDGYLLLSELDGELLISFKISGITASGTSTMRSTAEVIDPGKQVNITFPDGTDGSYDRDEMTYVIYKNAIDNTVGLDNINQTQQVVNDLTMNFGNGSTYHSHTLNETELKCINYRFGNRMFRLKLSQTTTDDNGTVNDSKIYYANNSYVYIGENGGYRSIPIRSVDKEALASLVDDNKPVNIVLGEDAFFNAELVYNEDDTMSLKADPRGASVWNQVNSLIDELETSLSGMGMTVSSITVNNVDANFIITSRGYVIKSEFVVDLDFAATLNGVSVEANSKTSIVVETIDPGQPVTISFPIVGN